MDIVNGTRVSDVERQRVVDLLGRHLADGRIDLVEFDRRLAHVYSATTGEDLVVVLSDLPAATARRTPVAPSRIPVWQRIEASSWLGVGLLCLGIWAAISLSVGAFTYFWPIWVIGPWGAVLAFRMLAGWESRAVKPAAR
ncbi:MAG: DUF1707 domain-containing protein [Mycobacteriaceae bacterium]|nr:DUF1707 domain-containing protein [Mycobacteriaceae bacterium]